MPTPSPPIPPPKIIIIIINNQLFLLGYFISEMASLFINLIKFQLTPLICLLSLYPHLSTFYIYSIPYCQGHCQYPNLSHHPFLTWTIAIASYLISLLLHLPPTIYYSHSSPFSKCKSDYITLLKTFQQLSNVLETKFQPLTMVFSLMKSVSCLPLPSPQVPLSEALPSTTYHTSYSFYLITLITK